MSTETEPHDEEHRFTGWFIPKDIVMLFDEGELTPSELILLAMVDSLSRKKECGCYATNEHFAARLKMQKDTISKAINKLIKMGILIPTAFDGRRRYLHTCWSAETRKIALSIRGRVGRQSDAASDANPIPSSLKGVRVDKKNTVPRGARDGARGGFFGEPTEPTFEEIAAKKLEEAIRIARKYEKSSNTKSWPQEFTKLLKQVGDKKRIKAALKWYIKNIGQKFVPHAYSAKAFREKFDAIEIQFERAVCGMSAAGGIEPTEEDQSIAESLLELPWPKGSKASLLACIAQTRTAYASWRKRVFALKDALGPDHRLSGLIDHMQWTLTANPRSFTKHWFRAVHAQVANWDQWSGDLTSHIFSPTHKLFAKMGRTEAADYAGQSADLWQKLTDRLNEN